ncbi:MFS general substrate transporter [Trametes coccinea BRFM310]|uniref:MFS general substrate transporter n=1 Tax=Trametes coccinea (strain BRFM310) TaxID=1353009 RepID=A0A1Y2IRE5_TRAC3|nr:MFS general substrate transporter [Trametes coccinea BRFM310]
MKLAVAETGRSPSPEEPTTYRLYKRRWIGLVALVLLNIAAGMVLVWFGPIANDMVTDFGFTLSQVNWLGNVVNVVYLPASVVVPYLYARLGTRGTCYIGAILFVVSAWIRYAGTPTSLSVGGSYALILIGQLISGSAVPIFQIVIPSYSQKWFDLKGRTTATMIMGVANPVGNALGQLIPPLVGSTRQSLLVMAIIFTVISPVVFFIGNAPPTPPTYAGTQEHQSMASLLQAMAGRTSRDEYTYMTMRQRIDFAIMTVVFGVIVGVINAFTILSGQYFEPYGYSDTVAGLMGAVLLLVGLIAAAITSPLYDRVLTHHLGLSVKVLCPILLACWLALIWEIKPNNEISCFVLMGIIGAIGLTLLPAVLELAVELTRNPDGSSALLWASTNLFGLIFVIVENALRAGPDANPPLNMRRAAIFQGVLVAVMILFVYLVEGKQTRRARDEERREELEHPSPLSELPTARASPGAEKSGEVQVREVRDRSEERPLEPVEEDVGEGGKHLRHHDHRSTVRRPRAVYYYDREPQGRPDEAVELGTVS